jgi:uncharacterized protein involved in exopolysaccharide biosynthesis
MKNSDNEYSSFNFIRFIASHWKLLTIITVVAGVVAFVCASFIKPHYKSTAVVFAPRTNSISKILLAEETNNERMDIKAYAIEEETEQMMELLSSRELLDKIIRKYHMREHYEIDTARKYWQTKLYENMEKSLDIKRTKYGAISITFEDRDPQLACAIANDVVNMLDTLKWETENARAAAAYAVMQKQLEDVNAEIDRVDDSIRVIMEHGVFDFETQSERVMQQWAIAVKEGNTAAQQRLQALLDTMAIWGPRAQALHDLQYSFREYQSLVKQKMMDSKVDMDNHIPTKFVVQRAIVADKKCYPKKSLIAVFAAISALILTIIILLVIENLKGMPAKGQEKSSEADAAPAEKDQPNAE